MARETALRDKRNAAIRKEYDRLREVREGRSRKYTADYIVTMLSERFFLSERTIEDIVWKARD